MTVEQKKNLIECIQEYFREDCEPEDIKRYGYIMPAFKMKDIISNVLFNKDSTKCTGFDKCLHRHYYVSNLTDEENVLLNNEFRKIALTGALTLTSSKRAVKVSESIICYKI